MLINLSISLQLVLVNLLSETSKLLQNVWPMNLLMLQKVLYMCAAMPSRRRMRSKELPRPTVEGLHNTLMQQGEFCLHLFSKLLVGKITDFSNVDVAVDPILSNKVESLQLYIYACAQEYRLFTILVKSARS